VRDVQNTVATHARCTRCDLTLAADRRGRLDAAGFAALAERLANAWIDLDTEAAVACFTADAVYIEPPDIQLFRGREQLRAYFGALREGTTMALRHVWFAEDSQCGALDFSFGQTAAPTAVHGVARRGGVWRRDRVLARVPASRAGLVPRVRRAQRRQGLGVDDRQLPLTLGVGWVRIVGTSEAMLSFYPDALGVDVVSAYDHGVSKAAYFFDRDDNAIEVYWDRPREQWPRDARGHLAMYSQSIPIDAVFRDALRSPWPSSSSRDGILKPICPDRGPREHVVARSDERKRVSVLGC
jgi:SnoaL-like domain